jgi:hypothetical protein
MASPETIKQGKRIGSDGGKRVFTDDGETVFKVPDIPAAVNMHDRGTRGRSADGVNKPIPETNNNRAPGQWGVS